MIGLRGLNLLIGIVSLNITFRVKTFWEALYLNLRKSCAKLLLCLKRYSVIPLHLLQICESFEDCFHWCIFSCLLALSIFELSLVPFWLSFSLFLLDLNLFVHWGASMASASSYLNSWSSLIHEKLTLFNFFFS